MQRMMQEVTAIFHIAAGLGFVQIKGRRIIGREIRP